MYEATKAEVEKLLEDYGYRPDVIPSLERESENVRRGIPVDAFIAISVIEYQSALQKIRKSNKRWWRFWA